MANPLIAARFTEYLDYADITMVPRDGILIAPREPAGCWEAVCATPEIAKILQEKLNGTADTPFGNYDVIRFKAGNDYDPETLRDALEGIGYRVAFINSQPWNTKIVPVLKPEVII